eukprot:Unigene10758_Nuclearia_a/m.32875 Unigene10758_Nuclearia_a/g.32875  ORF Unigene10758_Nuclearia_a/g.32875 Unigene10758_Nuclearia_a/m.32875 type:complete len:306 (+) Unigene10758_Nuclearia_a:687-1604(+)
MVDVEMCTVHKPGMIAFLSSWLSYLERLSRRLRMSLWTRCLLRLRILSSCSAAPSVRLLALVMSVSRMPFWCCSASRLSLMSSMMACVCIASPGAARSPSSSAPGSTLSYTVESRCIPLDRATSALGSLSSATIRFSADSSAASVSEFTLSASAAGSPSKSCSRDASVEGSGEAMDSGGEADAVRVADTMLVVAAVAAAAAISASCSALAAGSAEYRKNRSDCTNLPKKSRLTWSNTSLCARRMLSKSIVVPGALLMRRSTLAMAAADTFIFSGALGARYVAWMRRASSRIMPVSFAVALLTRRL